MIAGLLLLGCASLVFGFAKDVSLLDGARFIQGIAGALIWSGALTWLITAAPEEKRGSVIGTALGTAVAGALLGPALGALAASIGTEVVFSAVLVVAIGLSIARLAPAGDAGARAPGAARGDGDPGQPAGARCAPPSSPSPR